MRLLFFKAILFICIFSLTSCTLDEPAYFDPATPKLRQAKPKLTEETTPVIGSLLFNCYHDQHAVVFSDLDDACSPGSATAIGQHTYFEQAGLHYLVFRIYNISEVTGLPHTCTVNADYLADLQTGDESIYAYICGSPVGGYDCETIGLHYLSVGYSTDEFVQVNAVFTQEGWDCLCAAANDLIIPILFDCDCTS